MNLVEKHIRNTEKLIKAIDKAKIANWLLKEGYFPEQYILPPTFRVDGFKLASKPKVKDLEKIGRQKVISISYPKSLLTHREFGIQYPYYYHDIIYWMIQDWDDILKHLFNKDLSIYSYSFPIPVNARDKSKLSPLRSGRMIYEWIAMAEKDLVAEANKYNLIVRSDITNFYNSLYTHSIGWALHGQEAAFKDKAYKLTGNKIDHLVQYASYGRTNGIPVGSAFSDLIAEIVLASIDRNVSKRLKHLDFLATRFKDDYRILCHNKKDAKEILKVLADELILFNLLINESKTHILELPSGLYRHHDRAYHPHSLKYRKNINFKTFELTLLTALDIHREFSGTNVLEKFFSELFNDAHELKIVFAKEKNSQKKQILKTFSLLMLLKRESEKVLCHVLAILESIYTAHNKTHKLKEHLKLLIESEIEKATHKKSIFELAWLVFFARYMRLGVADTWINKTIDIELRKNLFLKSICESKQQIFKGAKVDLFRNPKECEDMTLAKRLAVFERKREE